MMILALVRNYIPQHQIVLDGGWNIADGVARSYDLEGMQVGTVAAGRIGTAVLRRLKPFDVGLHYFDRHRLPSDVEQELDLTFHDDVESLVSVCDVVTINAPLHPETENLFDEQLLGKMKKGAYLINTARGRIVNRDDVVTALESGQLAGYAGDVWYPQPAPADHPWRTMPHHGMTPHTSGTSLSAQARYAAGTREILECFLEDRPIRDEYLIVKGGALAGASTPTAPDPQPAAPAKKRTPRPPHDTGPRREAAVTRAEVTAEVLAAMRRENLTFTELAERSDADRVWLTAALLGQHPLPPDLARRVAETLSLSDQRLTLTTTAWPSRRIHLTSTATRRSRSRPSRRIRPTTPS
jgi:hypothetical protein